MFKQSLKLKKEHSKDHQKSSQSPLFLYKVFKDRELEYSPISKSQQEIRTTYDEIKTKLANLENKKESPYSFQKNEINTNNNKPVFIERR